jgi:hypothetical protein
MESNQESFRNELIKLAQSVEILENSFISNRKIEIITKIDENTFNQINNLLNYQKNEEKIIISIGNADFIFLKM